MLFSMPTRGAELAHCKALLFSTAHGVALAEHLQGRPCVPAIPTLRAALQLPACCSTCRLPPHWGRTRAQRLPAASPCSWWWPAC
jgi:hypothetical protein